jgi:hypothetical protein
MCRTLVGPIKEFQAIGVLTFGRLRQQYASTVFDAGAAIQDFDATGGIARQPEARRCHACGFILMELSRRYCGTYA